MLISSRRDTLSKLIKVLAISISIHKRISYQVSRFFLVPLKDDYRFENPVGSLLVLETSRRYSILRLETGVMLGVTWCGRVVVVAGGTREPGL